MKAKDAFPNLKFVGKNAKEFEEMDISEEVLEKAKKWGERGEWAGHNFRLAFKEKNVIYVPPPSRIQ